MKISIPFYNKSLRCSTFIVYICYTGGKRRPAKTKSGNGYLKAVMVQCVNALSRTKSDSRLVARFNSIRARRGHNKAVIAICRSMLTAIYHMLLESKVYHEPSLIKHFAKKKEAEIGVVSDDCLIQELIKRGYKLDTVT